MGKNKRSTSLSSAFGLKISPSQFATINIEQQATRLIYTVTMSSMKHNAAAADFDWNAFVRQPETQVAEDLAAATRERLRAVHANFQRFLSTQAPVHVPFHKRTAHTSEPPMPEPIVNEIFYNFISRPSFDIFDIC